MLLCPSGLGFSGARATAVPPCSSEAHSSPRASAKDWCRLPGAWIEGRGALGVLVAWEGEDGLTRLNALPAPEAACTPARLTCSCSDPPSFHPCASDPEEAILYLFSSVCSRACWLPGAARAAGGVIGGVMRTRLCRVTTCGRPGCAYRDARSASCDDHTADGSTLQRIGLMLAWPALAPTCAGGTCLSLVPPPPPPPPPGPSDGASSETPKKDSSNSGCRGGD